MNVDGMEIIISDDSSFEYCYNSPNNYTDSLGYKPGKLFSKSKDAALDFAKLYYNISLYIRFEISSVIYAVRSKGKIKYSYTKYIIGNPHYCAPLSGKKYVAKDGWIVGVIHTHPNTDYFSESDKQFAKRNYLAIYLVTPNKYLKVFHDTRRGFREELIRKNVKFSSLTNPQKNELVKKYRSKWKKHISEGCDFNCQNRKWPSW